MRLIIFANGTLSRPPNIRPDDRVIAADGGLHHALALGIIPQVLIGDLDSVGAAELRLIEEAKSEVRRYDRRKDFTDLELALQYAETQAADQVIIVAALGERWDQTLANLMLPAAGSDRRIILADGNQEIHYLASGETLELEGRAGDIVSLIPLSAEAAGITTEHLEYPLDDETLFFGSTRGVSNVMLGEHAAITLRRGRLACVLIRESAQPSV